MLQSERLFYNRLVRVTCYEHPRIPHTDPSEEKWNGPGACVAQMPNAYGRRRFSLNWVLKQRVIQEAARNE
ncbi:MAG: hypothetical protein HY746_05575 [Elusimicrobia bacterium]|nr:hypothetical protein [Elusimicrobiota bacterium]